VSKTIPTIFVTRNGVTFEVTSRNGTRWTVIAQHSQPSNHSNPEQYVGLDFTKGDSPDLRPVGPAQAIQRAVNRGDHAN
jgi:hypothetical protein